jgi:hypothetical protein
MSGLEGRLTTLMTEPGSQVPGRRPNTRETARSRQLGQTIYCSLLEHRPGRHGLCSGPLPHARPTAGSIGRRRAWLIRPKPRRPRQLRTCRVDRLVEQANQLRDRPGRRSTFQGNERRIMCRITPANSSFCIHGTEDRPTTQVEEPGSRDPGQARTAALVLAVAAASTAAVRRARRECRGRSRTVPGAISELRRPTTCSFASASGRSRRTVPWRLLRPPCGASGGRTDCCSSHEAVDDVIKNTAGATACEVFNERASTTSSSGEVGQCSGTLSAGHVHDERLGFLRSMARSSDRPARCLVRVGGGCP